MALDVTAFECIRLRWVSQGQVCMTARRDTKYIMLQSLRVELAVAVFGPGISPTGNNSASWSVWVCMLGQRKEDSCSVGVGTQPHIAPAFTVWPHSGGKLYLCVQWGTQWGTCWVALCMSACPRVQFCVLFCFGNSTYISFSLDFGCSFLSWFDSPRIWPTKCWKKPHSLMCASSLCFNNSKKNVMAGLNDFGNLDVFLDQHFFCWSWNNIPIKER